MSKLKRLFYYLFSIGVAWIVWKFLDRYASFLVRIILNIITLGIKKFKNEIYVEISKGLHEGPSVFLLVMFIMCLLGFIGYTIGYFTAYYSAPKAKPRKNVLSSAKIRLSLLVYILIGALYLILSQMRIIYINDAVTHFNQLYAIAAPYVEDNGEKEVYISKFAQIQNKEDYSNLLSDLKSIASKNNQVIPKFDIW